MSGAEVRLTDEERKRRYLERKATKQRKISAWNVQRTAERNVNLARCAEAIDFLVCATVREVSEHLGLNYNTVKKWILSLHEQKRIYIFDHVWRDDCVKRVPAYRVGNKPDVKLVKLKGPPRASYDDMDGESLSKADVNKKHEAWKQTWVPHCDVAAAWMMRG